MKFKEVTITSDTFVCNHCKNRMERGRRAVVRDERDAVPLEFCDALCLADYKEKRQSVKDRMFNRLKVRFN